MLRLFIRMSNYPSYASYFLRSFTGVSTANFRVPPQSSGQRVAHNQVDFVLPTNTLIKMDDVRLVFTASAVVAGNSNAPRLPPADAFIERVQVSMGGISVDSGCASTQVLNQVKRNYKMNEDPVTSHNHFYRNVMGANLDQLAAAPEAYTTNGDSTIFSIPLGSFFESIQPSLLDVSLLPEIRVSLFLSGNTIISSGTTGATVVGTTTPGNAQATYTFDNYSLLVPAWSIDDGVYSSVIASRLNDEGFLEASWCGYDSYQDTFTGTTRVASAASSLDKIICAFRPSTYSGINGAKAIAGSHSDRNATTTALANVLGQPQRNGGDGYLVAPLNFVAPMTTLPSAAAPTKLSQEPKLSISINNVRMPQYDCPASQWYVLTLQAFEKERTASESYIEYLSNRFCIAQKLNLPGSQGMRAKSGLDLRGSNSSIILSSVGDLTNFSNTGNVVVFLESTRILRIGAGKTLQVVL